MCHYVLFSRFRDRAFTRSTQIWFKMMMMFITISKVLHDMPGYCAGVCSSHLLFSRESLICVGAVTLFAHAHAFRIAQSLKITLICPWRMILIKVWQAWYTSMQPVIHRSRFVHHMYGLSAEFSNICLIVAHRIKIPSYAQDREHQHGTCATGLPGIMR